jgi:alkaline phosphatase
MENNTNDANVAAGTNAQTAKNTIVMIGDGMGWEMVRAAAIAKQIEAGAAGKTLNDFYTAGTGTGLNLQKLSGYGLVTTYGTTIADEKGVFGTGNSALDNSKPGTGESPLRPGFAFDPTFNPGSKSSGGGQASDGAKGNLVGYDPARGGVNPWTPGSDPEYIKKSYPDSANTATTLYTGVKSYNNAIGVDIFEQPLDSILKQASEAGKSTGLVSSVPIDHATPGAAAANVNRRNKYDGDYPALDNILQQELRIAQPTVLLGGGHPLSAPGDPLPAGVEPKTSNEFVGKTTYQELSQNSQNNIYGYNFLERGQDAANKLATAANKLDPNKGDRLLGLYGARGQNGNLPVSSANGDYSTTGLDMFSVGSSKGLKPDTLRPLNPGETDQQFIARERNENPTLADMTTASLDMLSKDQDGFWLMVEGGDIDWSAHDNNMDNLIGTVNDFDKSVGKVVDWIQKNGGWEKNELIITADHDHYLNLNNNFPELLRTQGAEKLTEIDTTKEAGHYWGSKPEVAKLADGKDDPESGKYGWGNHSNRPVPVYYQGAGTQTIARSVGQGFESYGQKIPGIPGLLDQTQIYQAQAAGLLGKAEEETNTGSQKDDVINASIKDVVFAGDGNDLVEIPDAESTIGGNRIYAGKGDDELYASYNDRLFGEAGNDILDATRGRGNNRLYGGDGKDQLFAGVNDSLFGENGQDQLFAGRGGSILYGGAGADNFNLANGSLPDKANTVADYQLNKDILSILGITDVNDFSKLMLSQQGANTLLKIGNREIANLDGIKFDSLQANNFTFS